MAKMDCGSKSKRRRRMPSQTSNASNQTQTTQLSFDSSAPSDTSSNKVKFTNSQTDVRQHLVQTHRKRTLSERPYSFDNEQERWGDHFAENSGGTTFFLESPTSPVGHNHCFNGRNPYGRRNTEHSVNTQVLERPPSYHADEFHRCNTTSCIHDRSMQQCARQNFPQSPNRPVGCQCSRIPYDNNMPPWTPVPLTSANRSRSASTVEHHYISLDPPNNGKLQPLETAVVLQGNGNAQVVPKAARNHRNSLDMLDTLETDSPGSEPSSGYCKQSDFIRQHMCGCLRNREFQFYQNGFYVLVGINILVLLICVVGLPVAYFLATEAEPGQAQHCLDDVDAERLLRGPYASALVMDPKSGKHCVSSKEMLKQVASVTSKESCPRALELTGHLSGNRKISWVDGRKRCGFSVSLDKQFIEINQTGMHFIYSRIHFQSNGLKSGQKFPVGHRIRKNSETLDFVTQTCLAGQGKMEHMSVLETTQHLRKGDKISVEVDAVSQKFASSGNSRSDGKSHRLGLIALPPWP